MNIVDPRLEQPVNHLRIKLARAEKASSQRATQTCTTSILDWSSPPGSIPEKLGRDSTDLRPGDDVTKGTLCLIID